MGLLPTISRVTRCGPKLTVGRRFEVSARSALGTTRLAATVVAPFRKSRRLLSIGDESALLGSLNDDVCLATDFPLMSLLQRKRTLPLPQLRVNLNPYFPAGVRGRSRVTDYLKRTDVAAAT